LNRPHIRVQTQRAAQAQQARFRPAVQRLRIPLRPAPGAQKHGVCLQAAVQRLLRQGLATLIDGHAAEGKLNQVCLEAELARAILQDRSCRADHFRADAIAGKNGDGPARLAHTAKSESAATSADWRPARRLMSSSVISFLASASAITWR